MKPDFMNNHNEENESITLDKAFMSRGSFPSDTRNFMFYIPFILL